MSILPGDAPLTRGERAFIALVLAGCFLAVALGVVFGWYAAS